MKKISTLKQTAPTHLVDHRSSINIYLEVPLEPIDFLFVFYIFKWITFTVFFLIGFRVHHRRGSRGMECLIWNLWDDCFEKVYLFGTWNRRETKVTIIVRPKCCLSYVQGVVGKTFDLAWQKWCEKLKNSIRGILNKFALPSLLEKAGRRRKSLNKETALKTREVCTLRWWLLSSKIFSVIISSLIFQWSY